MGGTSSLLYLVLIFAVMWFLLIRPQQKQAKKRAEMLTALKAGDKIVTTAVFAVSSADYRQ